MDSKAKTTDGDRAHREAAKSRAEASREGRSITPAPKPNSGTVER